MATRTRWMSVSWLTLLLLLVGILPAAAHPGLPPTAPFGPREAVPQAWGIGAPAPTAGWLMGGASVDSCTFYAIGGNLPGGVAVPNVDLYNPATDVWTARAPMPMGLYGIQPSASGSRIYVVGGYADSSVPVYAVTSTLIYDSASNAWSAGAPIPVGESGIGTAAQATYNGKIYVMGGDDGDADSNTTNYEYNIAANTWALRAPMPTARENNVAVTLNGKIYVAGGAGRGSRLQWLDHVRGLRPGRQYLGFTGAHAGWASLAGDRYRRRLHLRLWGRRQFRTNLLKPGNR